MSKYYNYLINYYFKKLNKQQQIFLIWLQNNQVEKKNVCKSWSE